jgi:hypothetical protein
LGAKLPENGEVFPMSHFGTTLVSVLALAVASCSSPPGSPVPIPDRVCREKSAVTDSIYLIGDAGAVKTRKRDAAGAVELVAPVLIELAADVLASASDLGPDRTRVVFLGDNVYPRGLQHEGTRGRERGVRVLAAEIASVGPAKGYFIAGNHDWDGRGPRGWEHVVEESDFLASHGPRIAMTPPGGCAGPVRVDVGGYLRLIFLDVIGWSHAARFPEENRPRCSHQTALDIFLTLADEFDHPEGRHVVLLTHNPVITAGPHGGHFTWKEHVFPLRDVFGPNWWIPLPVIGSIYPLARLLGVTSVDVSSEIYQQYIRAIDRASRPRVPMLLAAGHEHSLQVHRDPVGTFYVVSGAGSPSKVDRVRKTDTLLMGLAEPGYMRLDLHENGSLALTVFALHDGEKRRPVYEACLAHGPPSPGMTKRLAPWAFRWEPWNAFPAGSRSETVRDAGGCTARRSHWSGRRYSGISRGWRSPPSGSRCPPQPPSEKRTTPPLRSASSRGASRTANRWRAISPAMAGTFHLRWPGRAFRRERGASP